MQEDPIRPGHDALPQETDLSRPTGSVEKTGREWLMEGNDGGVDVDPALMAKLAGKDYSPREQRTFIDESGEARNLDKLDLQGTHYVVEDDGDPEFGLY
jgi:hypothetical protein